MGEAQTGDAMGKLQITGEYLTGAAHLHFIFPVTMNLTVANRSIDKPAKISTFKFPGGALLFAI
jgi:hypothetical protein